MDRIIAVFHVIFIFGLAVLFYRKEDTLKRFFWPALGARLLGAIGVGLVYTYYYPVGDTFLYFMDGSRLARFCREDLSACVELLLFNRHLDHIGPVLSEPRALFLSKITSVFNLITRDNYWVIAFYFSLTVFISAWFLVRVISRNFPSARSAALIAFLFLPSVAFWTGGLLKEGPSLAALCFLSAVFLKIWFREGLDWWHYVLAVFFLWVFWNLKYYYAGVFLAITSATLFYRFVIAKRFSFSAGVEVLAWAAVLAVPVMLTSSLHPNFHFDRLLHVIVENNAAYNALSAPEDVVRFNNLRAAPSSMVRNIPWALFSGLFRPLPWEVSSSIQLFAALENTFLLLLFSSATLRFGAYAASPHRLLTLAVVAFVVISAVLITMSAPNFGTLSRFRTGYICFFTFIISCNNPLLQYAERSLTRLVRH